MKQQAIIKKVIFAFFFLALISLQGIGAFAQMSAAAGTKIFNLAVASYKDSEGQFFETVSPTVEIAVSKISAFTVTPAEGTKPVVVAPGETITKAFTVCNTGNISANYLLDSVKVSAPSQVTGFYFDIDKNGEVSAGDLPITLNSTQSPQIAVNECVGILVVIETKNIAYGEEFSLSINVRSNTPDAVNGSIEKSAAVSGTAGKPAVFTHPDDPTLIPSKLVENKAFYISAKGEALNYVIAFKNSGDVSAGNVVVTDELPAELTYIKNTLRIGDRSLTDSPDADEGSVNNRLLTFKLTKPVAPGEVVKVYFQAAVTGSTVTGKGIINTAKISAANAQAVETSQAITVVDPFGTIYAARSNSSAPIAGAKVAITNDEAGTNTLTVPADQGFAPNVENTNPYITNSQGRYSFALRPDQLGSQAMPAIYYVTVTAEGYRPRLMQISLSPGQSGLFKMIVRSLDKMPLASAGGFELVQNDVEISNIADISFNIPMFEMSTLEITKTADRNQAEIGDILSYRVELKNSSIAPIQDTVAVDTLPQSFSYAPGSAQLVRGGQTVSIEPDINGNVLKFNVGEISSGQNFSILYRVRVGVNVRNGDNYNSASAQGRFASGEIIATPVTRVGVRIGGGVFSMRQVVMGRVFIDGDGNGNFDSGEKPAAGVRIYLASGESVMTDSKGLYSLPAVGEGAQVVGLDPITVPKGYVLAGGNSISEKSWTRLLRSPVGGGATLRQNFVLVPSKAKSPAGDSNSKDENAKSSTENEDSKSLSTKNILADMQESKIIPAEYDNTAASSAPEKASEFRPLAPGEIMIHSLKENAVVMTPAFNPEISVAAGWKTKVFLNGQAVKEENIGTTREDRKNNIVTYTYVGLGLKSGPNVLKVESYKDDVTGNNAALTVYGRGEAKRLEIVGDKREIEASGRDSALITIKAFDEWNNPAQDSAVMVETDGGSLLSAEDATNRQSADETSLGKGLSQTGGVASDKTAQIAGQSQIEIRNGVGTVKLLSDSQIKTAHLIAYSGSTKAETSVQFVSEVRPQMMVAVAELTIGKNAPEMQNRGVDENIRGHVQMFYRGQLFGTKNMLTFAYDSRQPLNRASGRDRFGAVNPLELTYPLTGDSSMRFRETESNSKVYARIDRGRSFAMFGDFTADMDSSRLMSYTRKLTGAKVHVENSNGDFITVTGARPDTSFARQIIPGGSLSIVRLDYPDVMPGSEVLAVETRDRRNPEQIISREILIRGLDYNIDSTTGTVFFLRPIQTFDHLLNLIQIVATYEYRSNGFESSVYTARASKTFNRFNDLRLGFSYIDQHQSDASPFRLGGLDMSVNLPNRGRLTAEWAMSRGTFNNGPGFFGLDSDTERAYNGNALFVTLEQPISFRQSVLKFEGSTSSENFYNPFGATVTPGNTRGVFSWEMKPANKTSLRLSLSAEKNLTSDVDNSRISAGVQWRQTVNEKLRIDFGYDVRRFSDSVSDKTVTSNLVTVGAEYKPTDRLTFAVKREQNLGQADPTYPNQTIIAADYKVNDWAKIFFTQRLAASAITPISDISTTGFGVSKSRSETAVGIETNLGKYTAVNGRYQIENGVGGADSRSAKSLARQ